MKPEDVIKGYWFYDNILSKPVQAKQDAQPDLVNLRRYEPLPITRELLLHFGFAESIAPRMVIYDKQGFRIYRRKNGEEYQLMHFGVLEKRLRFMHEVQRKFREEVPH